MSAPSSGPDSTSQPRRSRYRVVLNVLAVVWFLVCGLMLFLALVTAAFAIVGWFKPEILQPVKIDAATLLAMAVACGVVNLAVLLYGKNYFRKAYLRIAELERLERRGP